MIDILIHHFISVSGYYNKIIKFVLSHTTSNADLSYHCNCTGVLYTVCQYRLTGLYQYLHDATVLYAANVQVTCEHPTLHDTHFLCNIHRTAFHSLLSILHHLMLKSEANGEEGDDPIHEVSR